MVKDLFLKFGSSPLKAATPIPLTPITVFVGPNNSGKSKVLQELLHFFHSGRDNENALILKTCTFYPIDSQEADKIIDAATLKPGPGEFVNAGALIIGGRGNRQQVDLSSLRECLTNPNGRKDAFCQWLLRAQTVSLDGPNRISLVNQQGAGDYQQPGTNPIQILARDDALRSRVRQKIFDALGAYLVVDATNHGTLRYKLSKEAPTSPAIERSFEQEAVTFHRNATRIEETSDGVKAYTGILTEVMAGDPKVILIDEPEAFLHPSLAFKIGLEISTSTIGSDKRLFVATHSPHFLMGCIQSGAPLNIVRLTYRDGVPTARVLASDKVLTLMRNPLLRSTGVLAGIFYEFVVVCEADADRAFYEEINERLLRMDPTTGAPNCLFVNAQNKQTIHHIVKPLRELGIPTVGIVDVDVVKEGGQVWSNLLGAAHVPPMTFGPLSTLRASVKTALEDTGRDMKRDGGIDLLSSQDREGAENLFEQLGEYGIFSVRRGEVESWLENLDIAASHSPAWLIEVFEKLGEDPSKEGYVKPAPGDVWDFLRSVAKWLASPSRKGMPN